MSVLGRAARYEITSWGLSVAGYIRGVGWGDGKWHGDVCGCPDDRCVEYHHDAHEACGCLAHHIRTMLEARDAAATP